ncbi:MAG: hypothetical protein CR975_05660 [Gammaproteobacteria bacterium]|nr:MAG: hypothetical protein CR975_05660 [Gammaproteobacteria bacterium]
MLSKQKNREPVFEPSDEILSAIDEIEQERYALINPPGKFMSNGGLERFIVQCLCFVFIFFMLYFVGKNSFGFVFLCICFIALWCWVVWSIKSSQNGLIRSPAYTKSTLLILEELLDEVRYYQEGSIFEEYDYEFIEKFPQLKITGAEDLVEGRVDNTNISFGEIQCKERWFSPIPTRYFCFFADFNKYLKSNTILSPTFMSSLPKIDTSSFKKILLEDASFNKKWQTYSQDEVESRYILTPSFMEKILKISKVFKGYFWFSGNSMMFLGYFREKDNNLFDIDISVNNTITIGNYPDERQMQKEYIYEYIKETYIAIHQLKSIVNELNLNTIIWKS